MHDHKHCIHGISQDNVSRYGSRLQDGLAHTKDHACWTRRDFMSRLGLGAAGASMMLNGLPVTAFGHSPILHALNQRENGRVLVLIQLNGGNDALNMVVPYEIDEYYLQRPTISIPKGTVITLENDHGLHPAMTSLGNLWNDNKFGVVLNTGYANSTRSHFEGTVNWATGSGSGIGVNDSVSFNTGIWGRYAADVIDRMNGAPLTHPLAIRIGGPVSLFQSPYGNLGVSLGDSQFIEEIARRGLFDATDSRLNAFEFGDAVKYVREVANAALSYVKSIQNAANAGTNLAGAYPTGFGQNMAAAARLIRGGLGASVISVSIGGFDTHSNQGQVTGQHANLLQTLADSISAFMADMAADGLDEKVLLMTFSEFGRTLGENGSGGTDHGAGGSLMFAGKGITRGVYGQQSDLVSQLYGGDAAPLIDGRSVTASILQDWFGLPANEVDGLLGASFPRIDFIANKIRVSNEENSLPETFELKQNYPNPFNPSTNIVYSMNQPGSATLKVYNVEGKLVQTLIDGHHAAGRHEATFEAGNLPSGTYIYVLSTPSGTQTRKMVLVK